MKIQKYSKDAIKVVQLANAKSSINQHNCIKSTTSYHFIYNELKSGKCINETEKPINTYLNSTTNTYELCYEKCGRCSKKGDISNNNCDECAKDKNDNYISFSRI